METDGEGGEGWRCHWREESNPWNGMKIRCQLVGGQIFTLSTIQTLGFYLHLSPSIFSPDYGWRQMEMGEDGRSGGEKSNWWDEMEVGVKT
jgi:hypothetical protein